MKKIKLTIFIFLFTLSTGSFSADEARPTNVVDGGTDGDERFYTVYCSDGKRASLVDRYEINEICTQPSYSDKDICKDWTVDEAAIEACK